MTKVSVIIPVYNNEKYLGECLDSVVNQTLKDIEIICIDDGSIDNSFEILKKYAQKDERIKLIQQENSGAGVARNKGIKLAKGEYLSFIDSDDFIDLSYLEKLYNASNNGKVDVVATVNVKLIDEKLNQTFKNIYFKSKSLNFIERADMFIKTGIACNKIYKSSFIRDNDIYYLEYNTTGEDLYLTVFSLLLANKVNVIDETTYYYRQNLGSQTRIIKDERAYKIIDICQIIDKRLSNLKVNILKKICWQKKFKKRRENDFLMYYSSLHKDFRGKFRELLKKAYQNEKVKEPIKDLIVSLTSYPARINYVHEAIESIMYQTIEPEKIILALEEGDFPNKEQDLPKKLLDLQSIGLEILWTTDDIKSYKKLIPALKKYPQKVIVTADDDLIYSKEWLDKLYKAYLKKPNLVHCHRAHRVVFNKSKKIANYKNWPWEISNVLPSFNNFLTGGAGALYPVNTFYKDVSDKILFNKLSPTADDMWFWAMCVLNNKKINVIKDNISTLKYVEGTQNEGLWKINVVENQNDIQLKNILDYYPELLEKLDKRKISTCFMKYRNKPQHILTIKDWILKNKIKKILKTEKNKVLLWGASLFLEEIIINNKIDNPNILGIIDKNSNKWGTKIAGYKIFSPNQIKDLNAKKILLTIKNTNGLIYSDLKEFLKQKHPDIELLQNIFE